MSSVTINAENQISVSITGPADQLSHLRTLLSVFERMTACREHGAMYGVVTAIEYEAVGVLLYSFAKDAQKAANTETIEAVEAARKGRKPA